MVDDNVIYELILACDIPDNYSRGNVIPDDAEHVSSVTIGLGVPDFCAITNWTYEYPGLLEILSRWWWSSCPWQVSFTSIQINRGFSRKRHRDGANLGQSTMRALGDFRGGGLRYWPTDVGTDHVDSLRMEDSVRFTPSSWMQFDGRRAHETEYFEGSRISLVFYTIIGYENASEETRDSLLQSMVAFPME